MTLSRRKTHIDGDKWITVIGIFKMGVLDRSVVVGVHTHLSLFRVTMLPLPETPLEVIQTPVAK